MICLICVQNYTKKYGDKTVVNDISFTAKDGAITGFIATSRRTEKRRKVSSAMFPTAPITF